MSDRDENHARFFRWPNVVWIAAPELHLLLAEVLKSLWARWPHGRAWVVYAEAPVVQERLATVEHLLLVHQKRGLSLRGHEQVLVFPYRPDDLAPHTLGRLFGHRLSLVVERERDWALVKRRWLGWAVTQYNELTLQAEWLRDTLSELAHLFAFQFTLHMERGWVVIELCDNQFA